MKMTCLMSPAPLPSWQGALAPAYAARQKAKRTKVKQFRNGAFQSMSNTSNEEFTVDFGKLREIDGAVSVRLKIPREGGIVEATRTAHTTVRDDDQPPRGGGMRFRFCFGVVLASAGILLAATARAAEPAVIASRTLDVDGLRLHYLTAGKGEPLILLHGYAETSRMWRPVIPIFAEKFMVIAPDLPGIGESA